MGNMHRNNSYVSNIAALLFLSQFATDRLKARVIGHVQYAIMRILCAFSPTSLPLKQSSLLVDCIKTVTIRWFPSATRARDNDEIGFVFTLRWSRTEGLGRAIFCYWHSASSFGEHKSTLIWRRRRKVISFRGRLCVFGFVFLESNKGQTGGFADGIRIIGDTKKGFRQTEIEGNLKKWYICSLFLSFTIFWDRHSFIDNSCIRAH